MSNTYLRGVILVIVVIELAFLFSTCSDDEIITYPDCIQVKIDELSNQPVFNPPARIEQWEVNQIIFYYISSDCCDQFDNLYSEGCEFICAPTGGLSGNGDGKCIDLSNAIIRLVWEDPR